MHLVINFKEQNFAQYWRHALRPMRSIEKIKVYEKAADDKVK